MQTVEQPVSLADCPPGLFMFGDTLGFKTEYMAMEPVGTADVPGDQIRWRVSRWPDAYVVASGEYFWGGTSKHSDRAALLVQPVARFEASLPPSAPVDLQTCRSNVFFLQTTMQALVAALTKIAKPGVGAALDWSEKECLEYWARIVERNRKIARDALEAKTALPPSGIAEMVREMCAGMVESYDGPRCSASQLRGVLASAIRSLDLSNKGVG